MCKFFSFVSRKDGRRFYADWELRKKRDFQNCDSHTWLASHFLNDSGKPHNEDLLNKWEYSPLTMKLVADSLVFEESEMEVLDWCRNLDWKSIVEPLVIKPIIHPLRDVKMKRRKPTRKELRLLLSWISVRDSVWASVRDSIGDSVGASVRASVRASVGDSVRDSVGDSIGDSVWDSVWASVRDSIGDSVGASVRASVRASVGDSVRDSVGDSIGDSVWASVGASIGDSVWASVWDSVWAYISTFFQIDYLHDLSSGIKLWEAGLIPSFDEHHWRLHAGPNADVIWIGTLDDLRNQTKG